MAAVKMVVVVLIGGVLAASGCTLLSKRGSRDSMAGSSDLRFLDSGWDANQCGVRHARDNSIKVCVVGMGGSTAVGQTMAITAVKAWLKPLQDSFPGVTSSVTLDCNTPISL